MFTKKKKTKENNKNTISNNKLSQQSHRIKDDYTKIEVTDY